MSDRITRVKRRIIPGPSKGQTVKLGGFFSAMTQGGVPTGQWSPVELNKRFYTFQQPFLRAEFMCDQDDHKGPPYYVGGPFKSLKATYTEPQGLVGRNATTRNDSLEKYVGSFSPPGNEFLGGTDISNPNTFLGPTSWMFPEFSSYGAKAWQMAKPKIERASGFVFLAEAKDTPRMLRTTAKNFHQVWKLLGGSQIMRTMSPKNLADSFLNQQFGWAPFLSDLRRFNDVFQNSTRYLQQLRDRNDKWSRRKVTVLKTEDTTKLLSGTGQILNPVIGTHWSHYFSAEPTWELVQVTSTDISAVGSFKYYRPEFDPKLADVNPAWASIMGQLDLYGLRISPSNVWRATPWTWAIDWVTDASSYIDYANDILVDSLAAKYFYLMCHQTVKRILTVVYPLRSGTRTFQWYRTYETKQRAEGSSPFDFNLSWKDLTPRQLAIAAALFLTRSS